MVDILQDGVAWLDGIRQSHLASPVTYHRGAESIDTVATLGSTTFEVATEDGLTIQARSTDFLITSSVLVFGGFLTEPKIGDQIRMTVGTRILVFEVLDLGGTGHFRRSDPAGIVLRIHAKQIGEE